MTETTNTAPSPIPRFRLPAGVGWTLKLLLILFLLVPALIALALITSMVRDRENFERDAIRDIAERWGRRAADRRAFPDPDLHRYLHPPRRTRGPAGRDPNR